MHADSPSPVELGTHYNVVRVGDALRDPDDNRIVGYDGIFTGAGHVTRGGDPVTLIMTESARETEAGDKLIAGGIDVPLDFIPSPPKVKTSGSIMAVSDGVTVIGQYEVVVINRGAADGLAPGNVLAVYQAGEVIPDNANKGFLNSMTRLHSPEGSASRRADRHVHGVQDIRSFELWLDHGSHERHSRRRSSREPLSPSAFSPAGRAAQICALTLS